MPKTKSPIIFEFTDYRAFLVSWYDHFKSSRAGMSFRTFSKQAGFKSTNIFKLVMGRKRNLTEESMAKFAVGLGLNKQESEFFKNLVRLNQATSHQERDAHYKKILQSKKYNQLRPVEKNQYEYFSTWYHPVVRELATFPLGDGSADWISRTIRPALTVEQVKDSLGLMEQLGFLRKEKGRYIQSDTLITTGPEAQSIALHNYHQSLLTLAKELLPQVQAKNRDVSALVLGVAVEKIPLIKKKIQEFREELLKMVAEEKTPDKVIAIMVQLFPFT